MAVSATVRPMKIRMQWAAIVVGAAMVVGTGACKTNPAGKVPADTSILKYKSPDISEITGIEPPEDAEPVEATEEETTPPAPAPAPAAPKGK